MRKEEGEESRRVGREIWTVSQHLLVIDDKFTAGRAFTDLLYVVQESLRLHLRSQMMRRKSRVT